MLPPGTLALEYGRGPEYRLVRKTVTIPEAAEAEIEVRLERWINPADSGWFSGDHHIHAAGCSHYTSPTEGVMPADMFRYVKGEGLNVGCCLTWGPCFDFQRQFCGFPLKISGETDFPCITDARVGQGRVYVQLGKVDRVDFNAWCEGIRLGRSYVSDGYAHALDFRVAGVAPGLGEVRRDEAGELEVKARVAFAADQPLGTSVGGPGPTGPVRRVELVVNGKVAAAKDVPADGQPHEIRFSFRPEESCWVALRQFPEMHTNPVDVIVGGKPIRASRDSARWCPGVIEQLWRVRETQIDPAERPEAETTFQKAIAIFRRIASEAREGS